MSTAELQVKIRPMLFSDLKGIFSIDEAIREIERTDIGREITYRDFNTRKIFGMDMEKSDSAERPNILEVAKLIDLGFVAEAEGTICGFVVGRQTYLIEREIQEGEIAIISVHPDYQRKDIGHKLLNAICDLFSSRGVQRVRMGMDPRDGFLQSFLEREGFSSRHLMYYTKTC
ncbi:GNAT family N-acetyltransferase [Chloroflexota bacterium]